MAKEKYYVDWDCIDEKEAAALVDAVARYMNTTSFHSVETMCAILGIKYGTKENTNESY